MFERGNGAAERGGGGGKGLGVGGKRSWNGVAGSNQISSPAFFSRSANIE